MSAGACTCGSDDLEHCTCTWGDVVREMIAMGWHADPMTRAQLLPALGSRTATAIRFARERSALEVLDTWPGSQVDLARVMHISAGRIRQFAAARRAERST